MEPVCQPFADRWQMPLAWSRGYGSLKLQHDVVELIRRRRARTDQLAIIYFISDHDPSGFDLQRAWDEALENFRAPKVIVRIGLTTIDDPMYPNHLGCFRIGRVRIIDNQDETFSAIRNTLPLEWRRDIFGLAGVLRGNVTILLERR